MGNAVIRLSFVTDKVIICALKNKTVCYVNCVSGAVISQFDFYTNYDMHSCMRNFKCEQADMNVIIGGSYGLWFTSYKYRKSMIIYQKLDLQKTIYKDKLPPNASQTYFVTDVCLNKKGNY